jgi:hypothetical protein
MATAEEINRVRQATGNALTGFEIERLINNGTINTSQHND